MSSLLEMTEALDTNVPLNRLFSGRNPASTELATDSATKPKGVGAVDAQRFIE